MGNDFTETEAVLEIVKRHAATWRLLWQYDEDNLPPPGRKAGGEGLAGIIGALHQTFGGRELYPIIEEKAAHRLGGPDPADRHKRSRAEGSADPVDC